MEITIESEPKFNIKEEVAKVENAKEIISNQRTSKAKIQKVPAFLRERPTSCDHYSPKLLSIGPIHHCKDNVKVGEQYKHTWTAMYLSRAKNEQQGNWKTIDEYRKIKDKIVKEVIEQCYSEDVIEEKHKENNYEPLAWMLFVDGCSVLEFMDKASFQSPQVLNIKIDQLILMLQDMLLLENQIPFELLKLLCPKQDELFSSMDKFVKLHHMVPHRATISQPGAPSRHPTHLLGYVRNKIVGDDQPKIDVPQEDKNAMSKWPRHRNIQELKAAGIKVTSLEKGNIRNIHFSSYLFSGRLYLPEVIVDDSTATTYMNLIAYEMCPDFKNDFAISSYVSFLDSLIDHTDYVKELRTAGILHNNLGSDEYVANLFNTIATDLVPDPKACYEVRKMMEEHCGYKCKTWMAECKYTHFQSPWSVLALLAAILVLGLTCAQTYLAIPNK